MKRLLAAVLVAAVCLSLCGCGILNEEYYSKTPHAVEFEPMDSGKIQEAASFEELKSAVLQFVANQYATGTVRLINYTGNVSGDMMAIRSYILREDALGCYSVEDLIYTVEQVVSYYEVSVQITYARTAVEIGSIISVADTTQAYAALNEAIRQHADKVTLKLSYFMGWEDRIESYCEDIYYDNPLSALMPPSVSYNVYPEEGVERIIEVLFEYELDEETYAKFRDMVAAKTDEIVLAMASEGLQNDPAAQKEVLLQFYRYLTNHVDYDETSVLLSISGNNWVMNLSYTPFGALINGLATGEGIALTYKLLCDQVGIECLVVRGRRDSYDHAWNIVYVDGAYHHVDASNGEKFLLGDNQMPDNYVWNRERYPLCKGG